MSNNAIFLFMLVVILAGGRGTRLGEMGERVPKPLTLIGSKPVIWHIMKRFSNFGYTQFLILGGFKFEMLKDFFEINGNKESNWSVKVIDTGLDSETGGRLLNASNQMDLGDSFFLTYGDTLANIDIKSLVNFYKLNEFNSILTGTKPVSRFGKLILDGNLVKEFQEKPNFDYYVNGGFMILEKSILKLIRGTKISLEYDILPELAKENKLGAFLHEGFWQPMDTPREVSILSRAFEERGEQSPWLI
jgi:glucose-1-phosphate cytidylyltransferase